MSYEQWLNAYWNAPAQTYLLCAGLGLAVAFLIGYLLLKSAPKGRTALRLWAAVALGLLFVFPVVSGATWLALWAMPMRNNYPEFATRFDEEASERQGGLAAANEASSQDWVFGRWVTVETPRVELEIDETAINITVPGRNGNPDVFVIDRYRVLDVSDRCVRTQRLGTERTSRMSGERARRTPAPDDRLIFCQQGDRQMMLRHIPVDGERSEVLYRRAG